MDDDTWGFVLGALSMCTTVDGREFEPGDLDRDECILWRAPYRGSPTINFGGVTVYLHEEICRRYIGEHGQIGMTCDMVQCLNPQHFTLERAPRRRGDGWEHVNEDESLLLRTALWANDPEADPAPGWLDGSDPEKFLPPRVRLYYEMLFR